MIHLKDKTIAEIVSEDIGTASIFKKYQLDFCCGGGTTVENACKKAKIDLNTVIKDLETDRRSNTAVSHSFKDWSAEFLADYIVNVHHNYVLENLAISQFFS